MVAETNVPGVVPETRPVEDGENRRAEATSSKAIEPSLQFLAEVADRSAIIEVARVQSSSFSLLLSGRRQAFQFIVGWGRRAVLG